ncbi:hypothetical protein HDA45_005736 [Amycolatopsis umgeniensis]|uniref:Uncharacterized protein n=1 Tax=Amycolatopsis umgeniensis TaxID=336628 RepID=A0A841B3N0_9PSEU|nr:hypothetical protein [Amycolatopsis umgeniensis]
MSLTPKISHHPSLKTMEKALSNFFCRRPPGIQRPVQIGSLFSAKARGPSLASALR